MVKQVYVQQFNSIQSQTGSKYLVAKFKQQMLTLMDELNACECHFIRCIKPNETKQKDNFVPALSLMQIRYMGVLEALKVRKVGYPNRMHFEAFCKKFCEIMPGIDRFELLKQKKCDFRELATRINKEFFFSVGTDKMLFGKSKVFLRVSGTMAIQNIFDQHVTYFFKIILY